MALLHLESLTDPRLRVFSSFTDSELKDPKQMIGLSLAAHVSGLEQGLFIAESKNVIERALANGYKPFCFMVEECWVHQSSNLIEHIQKTYDNVPCFILNAQQRKELTGYEMTKGPLAAFHRAEPRSIKDLLKNAKRVAILEDVTNFTNIGAIFRSAAALGVDAVLITPSCHDPLYRRASRVSMGTVFQVPWTRIGNDPDWAQKEIPALHEQGFKVAAMALNDSSISLRDKQLKECEKLAIVLGTEGEGLRQSTIEACDFVVKIPMHHEVDSLNVAAASAVAFWELCS